MPQDHKHLNELLLKLNNVRSRGPRSWSASCPTREDKNPSLSICLGDNDQILLYDHGGEKTKNILNALGMTFSDLYPKRGQ